MLSLGDLPEGVPGTRKGLANCKMEDFQGNQPDIYIETPSIPFKSSPETVKRRGLLSKSWKTELVRRMEVGFEGAYFGWNFHERPHCQVERSQRKYVEMVARGKGI